MPTGAVAVTGTRLDKDYILTIGLLDGATGASRWRTEFHKLAVPQLEGVAFD